MSFLDRLATELVFDAGLVAFPIRRAEAVCNSIEHRDLLPNLDTLALRCSATNQQETCSMKRLFDTKALRQ